MAEYSLTETEVVVRVSDGAFIPNDPANRDRAEYDAWVADGNEPDPYVPPEPSPITEVLSQDLMAQFTSVDAAAIRAAVESNASFWLLWSALQAQKDPMHIDNTRFRAGWSALTSVLGSARMAEIAATLGITL